MLFLVDWPCPSMFSNVSGPSTNIFGLEPMGWFIEQIKRGDGTSDLETGQHNHIG